MSWRPFTCTGARAGLDFTVERLADWTEVPFEQEQIDFDDPRRLAPLALLMAPYAAIVFAVSARPAYAEGTVAQWLEWLARENGLDPGALEPQAAGPHAGVACWGIQIEAGGAVMRARLVMFEDGGRIVQISCMAPDALWGSVAATLEHMLATFRLTAPNGSAVALGVAPPAAEPPPPARGPLRLPGDEPATATPVDDADADDAVDGTPARDVALAQDQRSFDPEHELNARLRDRGAGLVPNVLDYHEQELWATLGSGALRATLRVPFGWHALDDGRRLLVFDADGHTQVSLQLLRREGRSDDELLAEKVPELQREWPQLRHERTEAHGLACLLVRAVEVDGAPIEQAYLLRAAPDDLVLQTRVTSTPERMPAANGLAEVLLRDLQFAGAS